MKKWPVSSIQWPVTKEDTACLGLYSFAVCGLLGCRRDVAVGGADPPLGAPISPDWLFDLSIPIGGD